MDWMMIMTMLGTGIGWGNVGHSTPDIESPVLYYQCIMRS